MIGLDIMAQLGQTVVMNIHDNVVFDVEALTDSDYAKFGLGLPATAAGVVVEVQGRLVVVDPAGEGESTRAWMRRLGIPHLPFTVPAYAVESDPRC